MLALLRRPLFSLTALFAVLAATAAGAQTPNPPATPTSPVPAVKPVTVTPESHPKGGVVASTDKVPLASPKFTDKDAAPPRLVVDLGDGAVLGARSQPNTPVGGLLGSNPDLTEGVRTTTLGISVVQ